MTLIWLQNRSGDKACWSFVGRLQLWKVESAVHGRCFRDRNAKWLLHLSGQVIMLAVGMCANTFLGCMLMAAQTGILHSQRYASYVNCDMHRIWWLQPPQCDQDWVWGYIRPTSPPFAKHLTTTLTPTLTSPHHLSLQCAYHTHHSPYGLHSCLVQSEWLGCRVTANCQQHLKQRDNTTHQHRHNGYQPHVPWCGCIHMHIIK